MAAVVGRCKAKPSLCAFTFKHAVPRLRADITPNWSGHIRGFQKPDPTVLFPISVFPCLSSSHQRTYITESNLAVASPLSQEILTRQRNTTWSRPRALRRLAPPHAGSRDISPGRDSTHFPGQTCSGHPTPHPPPEAIPPPKDPDPTRSLIPPPTSRLNPSPRRVGCDTRGI